MQKNCQMVKKCWIVPIKTSVTRNLVNKTAMTEAIGAYFSTDVEADMRSFERREVKEAHV